MKTTYTVNEYYCVNEDRSGVYTINNILPYLLIKRKKTSKIPRYLMSNVFTHQDVIHVNYDNDYREKPLRHIFYGQLNSPAFNDPTEAQKWLDELMKHGQPNTQMELRVTEHREMND